MLLETWPTRHVPSRLPASLPPAPAAQGNRDVVGVGSSYSGGVLITGGSGLGIGSFALGVSWAGPRSRQHCVGDKGGLGSFRVGNMDNTQRPDPVAKRYAPNRRLRKAIWQSLSRDVGAVYGLIPYGRVYSWSAKERSSYRKVLNTANSLVEHVQPGICRGNGRSCACRLLRLVQNGVDPERRHAVSERRPTVIMSLTSILVAALFTFFLFDTLDEAVTGSNSGTIPSDRVFGIYSGMVNGSIIVAFVTIMTVWQYTLILIYDYLAWVGTHPEHGRRWIQRLRLFGLLSPKRRRELRTARLRRELQVVTAKMSEDLAQAAPRASRTEPSSPNRQRTQALAVSGFALGAATAAAYFLRRQR